MVVKLYGSDLSSATRRAALVLIEKQVPFEFVKVNLAQGEHKKPEYVGKYHPFGQVPALEVSLNYQSNFTFSPIKG